MTKRLISLFLIAMLSLTVVPLTSLAAAKQMNDGVPVWTEKTVKDYAEKFIRGEDMETLWGYYDLQIRRYLPMETFQGLLAEIQWMTGDFVGFGTYRSFQEPQVKTKTHVLHLAMEKQDMDLYFTHKDKEDDWEIMAVEFVPAEKQIVSGNAFVSAEESVAPSYTEQPVVVGGAPYELKGILTLPAGASADSPVRACVLVHGSGALDMDSTVGQTKLFADIAGDFADKGIATLRYDKRTYTYGASMTAEEVASISVEEEVIQDAIAAGNLLQEHEAIDSDKIILVGHSMGAMLAPRIATEAKGVFSAMVLMAGTPKTLLDIVIEQNQDVIAKLAPEEQEAQNAKLAPVIEQAAGLAKMSEDEARSTTILGLNGYYFWEMEQHDGVKLIQKLKLPTYIIQGSEDFQIALESGVEAYEDKLGEDLPYVDYKTYRGLNHLFMEFTGNAADKGTVQEYQSPAVLSPVAARDMAAWINGLWEADQ